MRFARRAIILSVMAAALIGFGVGLGLLLQYSPHALWFAANAPGLYLFSPIAEPGGSAWMIPFGNAVAYVGIAMLFLCLVGFIHKLRRNVLT
jgi:hypothetical protein